MRITSKILKGVLVALFLSLPGIVFATSAFEGNVISKTAQPINFTQSLDMSGIDAVSMQAVYASTTPPTWTLSTGAKSWTTITVNSFTALTTATAGVRITVSSNSTTALTGAIININGALFRQGIEWQIGASSITTAKSISDAIDLTSALASTYTLTNNAIIFASAAVTGSAYNSYAITSSTSALSLSAATFTGGQDNATIYIPTLGVTLTANTNFFPLTSTTITAKSISDAILGNTTLAAVMTSTFTTNVVTATITVNGLSDYPISVSTPALIVTNFGFSGGAPSFVSVANDSFSQINHFYSTGLGVLYSSGATVNNISGLTNQTTYFVIVVDTNTFKLATTTTTAAAGTAIDITAISTASTNGTFAPLTFAVGNSSFKWQASNDNSNWTDLSITTVTASNISTGGNSIWDLARYGYRYIRMNFVGPTSGGVNLTVRQYGKKD